MPPFALDAEHGDTEFNVFPSGVCYCLGPILPSYFLIPPFWKVNIYPVLLYVGSI
jgi:hypothetical protein